MTDWYLKAIPDDPGKRRKTLIAAGVGVGIVVLVGAFLSAGTPESHVTDVTPPARDSVATASEGTVFVHVAGLVTTPGVYEVARDSRVFDAIAAAGGMTDAADVTSINLARIVQDGEQIVVTPVGATGSAGPTGKLNINRAEAKDFDSLPRIGPTLAERIVDYRDEHGPFASIDALGNVPGIGDVTLAGFRDQLTL